MQHDGSTARAYEILAWVHRNGGSGRLEDGYSSQGPDTLQIGYGDASVSDGMWVVKVENPKDFKVISDVDFRKTYEQVPPLGQSGGGGGGGIPNSIRGA